MKKALALLGIALLALVAYLCLWPVPVDAVSWQVPAAPG